MQASGVDASLMASAATETASITCSTNVFDAPKKPSNIAQRPKTAWRAMEISLRCN